MAIFNKTSGEEKAVNELIGKKEMLMSAVQKEINTINLQITNEYQYIGYVVYSSYTENSVADVDVSKFHETLSKIDGYKKNITEKEIKLQEICTRYDDEIKILKNSLGIQEEICPTCKRPYNKNVDKFCMGCGSKLA